MKELPGQGIDSYAGGYGNGEVEIWFDFITPGVSLSRPDGYEKNKYVSVKRIRWVLVDGVPAKMYEMEMQGNAKEFAKEEMLYFPRVGGGLSATLVLHGRCNDEAGCEVAKSILGTVVFD